VGFVINQLPLPAPRVRHKSTFSTKIWRMDPPFPFHTEICLLETRLTELGLRIPKRECASCLVVTLLEKPNYLKYAYSLAGGAKFRISKPRLISLMPQEKDLLPSSHVHSPPFKRHESRINAEHLNPGLIYKYDSATVYAGRGPQNSHYRKYK